MQNFDPKNSDHVGALWMAEQQMKEGKRPLTHVPTANMLAETLYRDKYRSALDRLQDTKEDDKLW